MRHVGAMIRRLIATCLALGALFANPVQANAPPGMLEARILPGWRMADGRHMAAIRIILKDGWKTYWRAPGDAGIPPAFDWRGSRNLGGTAITWPAPRRIDQGGLLTFGYHDAVTLPLTVTPSRTGRPVRLEGVLEMGVCKDICVPVRLTVAADLPRDVTRPDPRIVAALAERPLSAGEAGVSRVSCRLRPIEDGLGLVAEITMPSAGGDELAVIETADPRVWVARTTAMRQGPRLIAETELVHVEGRSFMLDRSGLRITVLGNDHAVDIRGCASSG